MSHGDPVGNAVEEGMKGDIGILTGRSGINAVTYGQSARSGGGGYALSGRPYRMRGWLQRLWNRVFGATWRWLSILGFLTGAVVASSTLGWPETGDHALRFAVVIAVATLAPVVILRSVFVLTDVSVKLAGPALKLVFCLGIGLFVVYVLPQLLF